MRFAVLTCTLVAVAAPVAAQQGDPDRAVAGGGTLPPGWTARTDRNAPLAQLKFATMGNGYHVTTGPAVVLYRAADTAQGSYHVVATFTQTVAPRHPEAYGLILGGSDLQAANQAYTYFLVRGDGTFLVKRRQGDSTWAVSAGDTPQSRGFTSHAAVVKADSAGRQTNELGIAVGPERVRFLVNGKDVLIVPAAQVNTKGTFGLRVNHNLDVHVAGLEVHRF